MGNIKKSIEVYENAKKYVPGGIKGMHKIFSINKYPAYYMSGDGCYVYDIDGNKYIDFVMGKGPCILGYNIKKINDSIIDIVPKGNIFPMGNNYQSKVAEILVNEIPSGENVVFYKTGSCATTAAVRLARAYTGKEIVLSSGYHGWHDWCSQGRGIVEGNKNVFLDFEYNLDLFDDYFNIYKGKIACVIITPEEYYFNIEFYKYIQYKCVEQSIIFILDEVKSGFRIDFGGFQNKYGLMPDITCVSKAISNGYSLAAIVGKKEILDIDEEIHTAGTYDFEVIPYVASYECLKILKEEDVAKKIELSGSVFVKNLDNLFKTYDIDLYPVFSTGSFRIWSSDENIERKFYSCMAQKNVLFYAFDNSYISFAHSNEILEEVINKVEEAICEGYIPTGRKFKNFDFEYIKTELTNKKGFLKNYVGVTGRENNE